jgi:hypothetical protein
MSNAPFKWGLGLVLLGMLADTISPHPLLQAENEHQQEGVIPRPAVLGFANERNWLFAHREFRNQCVLEAFAEDRKLSGKKLQLVSSRLDEHMPISDLRLRSND